jgi:glycosyltransferase domain-containing protein
MLRDLAIIIPTYNRPHFLNRALLFYSKINFGGCLYIVDGSDDPHRHVNRQIIDSYKNRIKYFYDPDSINEVVRMAKIRHLIMEKYVTFSGDDDFQLPIGLSHCINFLNNNRDYDVCFGYKINFIEENNKLKMIGLNINHEWNYDSPSKRYLEYMMEGNSTNYCVHRNHIWDRILSKTDIPIRYIGTELIMCASTVILSRMKRLDRIQILYEDSGLTWPHVKCDTGVDLPPIYQLVHSVEWINGVNELREHIVNLILGCEDITKDKATHIFNMGYGFRLYQMLEDQFLRKYGKEFVSMHKDFVKEANTQRDVGNIKLYGDDLNFIADGMGVDISCLNIRTPQF